MRGFPEETYWYAGLLILFLLLVPTFLWRLGAGMEADWQALNANGQVALGEVTATTRSFNTHSGSYGHWVHYAFEVNGVRYEEKDITDAGEWSGFGRGQTVEVTYLPGDPTVSRLFQRQENFSSGETPQMLAVLFAALGVYGLFAVIRSGRRARRAAPPDPVD